MNSVVSSLAVTNETDIRGQALLALITSKLNVQGYYGFRPTAANDLAYPCVMIDPISQKTEMERLGKYTLRITYAVYWFCQESSAEAIVTQTTFIGEALIKLLSNNALDDLGTANTNKFKTYPNGSGGYYWLNSDTAPVEWSTTFLNQATDPQPVYMRGGKMTFNIEDVVIK